MNYGRLILGGLLAGVILTLGEFVLNAFIVHSMMVEWAARHNFPEDPGPTFMFAAIALTIVLGVVTIWLYAMIRPRSGPGPKTAVCAALFMWFAVYIYCGIIFGLLLVQPLNAIAISIVWGLGEFVIAAVAGAWLYKEA